MQVQVQPLLAFGAGIVSFLSPCIIPIIPSYMTFLCGTSLQEVNRAAVPRIRAVGRTAFFALGFSLVFVALGLFMSGIGSALGPGSRIIAMVSGALIIVFGLNLIFDFWAMLNRERRIHFSQPPRGFGGAVLVGMAFGAGWTPCVGPILASILLLAGTAGNPGRGALLLLAYSAGLGLPFLLASILFNPLMQRLAKIRRSLPAIRIASGAFLVLLGALVILGRLQRMNSWLFMFSGILHAWSEGEPWASRFVFAGVFAACAAALVISMIIAVRRRGPFPVVRTASFAFFSALAALTLAGVVDVSAFLASWLSFRGL